MTKFKIYFAVKSAFEFEIEAETVEEAEQKKNEASIIIEEAIKFTAQAKEYKVSDIWGGEEDEVKAIQDLTQIKTTKAFRSRGNIFGYEYTDTAYCPYCEAENDNLAIVKKEGSCTIVKNSCQYDTDEANAKMFECTCWKCGQIFRVDYFKEV